MKTRAALIAFALAIVACGDDAPTVDTPEYRAFRDQPTACGAERPEPARQMSFTAPEALGLTGTVAVTLETSCGEIELLLDSDLAPATVNSFVFLAEQGYFDGTAAHRILPGFVIQAGDPTASGMGDPGYRLPDELPEEGFVYGAGVVAMANAGPGTSGSQFFIVLGDTDLPAAYSVFGSVVGGFEVIDEIARLPLGFRPGSAEPSYPMQTLYLERVTGDR